MKRDESVFFFTLIDFLIASLFFGLVLFAVQQVRAKDAAESTGVLEKQIESLKKASGVSDLTELTDLLTRLAPLRDAAKAVETIRDAGGPDSVSKALAAISAAGGADSVTARLERLRQREGVGRPHCLERQVAGKPEAIPVATLIANDSTLTVASASDEWAPLLATLGVSADQARVLPFREFRRSFQKVVSVHPKCLYTVNLVERTRYVDARDAVRGLFYTRIRKQ